MKTAYLLYEGDSWLSRSSLVLMGVFTTKEKLFSAVKQYVLENRANFRDYELEAEYGKESNRELSRRVLNEFCEYDLQTQGYDHNLHAQEINLNELKEI